jgi:WhiB family transcriptional regulator, redox-sensing transcriptional regulator
VNSLHSELVVVQNLKWMAKARCKGRSDLFFSPLFERPNVRQNREAEAMAVCARCSVSDECREFGRVNHEYGFWGGENEAERVAAGYRLNAPVGMRRHRSSNSLLSR